MEEELHYFETDSTRAYIQEIRKNPVLSVTEQKELARLYQKGDLSAKQKLINCNLRFVVNIAYKFKDRLKTLDVLDIIQEGNLGLIRAIETYDPEQCAFTTYAHDWIYQHIDRAIKNKNNEIRTPVHFQEYKNKYLKLIQHYTNANISLPSDEEICDMLNITQDTLNLIKDSNKYNTDSLNRTIGEEENSELQDFIQYHDNETEQVEKSIDNTLFLLTLKTNLSPLHYFILYKTVLNEEQTTLRNISNLFDVTPERIRQIQEKALQKSKKILQNKKTKKLDSNTNIYPIEPNDLITYIYLKDGLSDIENKLLYLNIIDKNKYSIDEYCKFLNCTTNEYKTLMTNLKHLITLKMQNKSAFIRFKNNLLKTYGVNIYTLLNNQSEIIDFYSLKEKYDNYTYEDILEYFQDEISTLTPKEQELLKSYFFQTPKFYINKRLIERKINLAIKNSYKTTTDLPKKILFRTLKDNKHLFKKEQILYLECYYFKTKDKKVFKEKYPNYTNRNSTTLIQRLESIYFNLNRILENNFTREKYLSVRDKLNETQILYLDLFYGYSKKPLTITEIAQYFQEDYIKLHDKIRDARNNAINIYCNRSGKKQITKEVYIPYIQNKAYDFKEETRNILKMYLIDNMTYDEIASITNLSNYKISNLITEAIRKLDFYRYNICNVFIITEQEFYDFIKYHNNYTEVEQEILRLRFLEYKNLDEISTTTNTNKKEINILVANFIKLYNKYTIRDIELTNTDILKALNTHHTESILTEEEKEIIALYTAVKSKYNPNGIKLTANEIAIIKNSTRNIIYQIALRCLDRMKLDKINKYQKDLCYIKRDELDNLLDDPFLPITEKEQEIICHLFALKNYKYKTLEEISKLYSITESSTRRRYQRAMLNILKYQNNEIEGTITYKSIYPNLKYFSNSDRIFIEEYYRFGLTYEEISKKYQLTKDKVVGIFNRIKPFIYELIKDEEVKKFDFDYYEQVKREVDLPFYGDLEEAIKIFDLYFGQTHIERKSVPEIIKELNLSIHTTAVNKLIYSLLVSVEKYKIGIKKQEIYTFEDVLNYYNSHKEEMTPSQIKTYQKYFNKINKKKFHNSKYQYPEEEILFDLIKDNEDYIPLDKLTKEEVFKILRNPKIKIFKHTKQLIISYFNIQSRDLINGKDKNKVYRILDKLEKQKTYQTDTDKSITKKE